MNILNILSNVTFLFVVMIVTQIFSILGQWFEARKTGSTMTLMELFTYWPQLVIGFGLSVSAFVTLHESGMLNLASAMGVGGIVNKFSDILATRRTKAITDSIPSNTDHRALR